jgi:hypothetical protein
MVLLLHWSHSRKALQCLQAACVCAPRHATPRSAAQVLPGLFCEQKRPCSRRCRTHCMATPSCTTLAFVLFGVRPTAGAAADAVVGRLRAQPMYSMPGAACRDAAAAMHACPTQACERAAQPLRVAGAVSSAFLACVCVCVCVCVHGTLVCGCVVVARSAGRCWLLNACNCRHPTTVDTAQGWGRSQLLTTDAKFHTVC